MTAQNDKASSEAAKEAAQSIADCELDTELAMISMFKASQDFAKAFLDLRLGYMKSLRSALDNPTAPMATMSQMMQTQIEALEKMAKHVKDEARRRD